MKKKISVIFLVLIMVMAMTACGGSDQGGEDAQQGTVYVYCFGDYIDPELVYDFEDKTGYSVVIDYFDTNEEMYPVIKNNTVQYDVINASDYMIEKMIGEDLLAEIDFANVENAENILDNIKPFVEDFDPGMKYSVPHTWGTYGIMYNKNMVSEKIDSWSVLWDEKYKQQIVMPDSIRESYMIAAKLKGYSINTTEESEISDMTDTLIEQKPLVYSFANDRAREIMIGESAAMAVITSGEVLYSQELNENLEYVVPKEGTEVWTDCWAIPKSAANKKAAEAWINFMLDGETALANYEYLTYAIPNKQIADVMDNSVLSPSSDELKNCETLKSFPAEVDDLYSKYWKIFKSK